VSAVPRYFQTIRRICVGSLVSGCVALSGAAGLAQSSEPLPVSVNWNETLLALKTTPTLQVVVNPMLRRGSPVHDGAFAALRSLGADYVRYVPWYPYPKLVVAELEAPTATKTSWDFSLIDPMTEDFFAATKGHTTILNFSTIPAWMFKTPEPVPYPPDPNTVDVNYRARTALRDLSLRELTGYYSRLVSWYTQGGFTDELGLRHESGHHYKIDYWEVFNEMEHHPTPKQYAEQYDAVVEAIRKVSPDTKFVALATGEADVKMFEYFLDHSHHHAGIPLDFITYHFYARPTLEQTLDHWQYTMFDQADGFVLAVKFVEAMRKHLSPETKTALDEVGTILPTDNTPEDSKELIPAAYWNLSGAVYAYVFMESAQLGIDVVNESQLVGYPSQFPSTSMVDWKDGSPNARYRVLQLLHDNLSADDRLVDTDMDDATDVAAQAFISREERKLLLVNKRNWAIAVALPGDFATGRATTVDVTTGAQPPVTKSFEGPRYVLQPFAVSLLVAAK